MKSKYSIIIVILFVLLGALGCKEDEPSTWESLPACPDTPIITALPLAQEDILNFQPLGHYAQPGHTFPTGHHYFDKVMEHGVVSVYAACDGWIINVIETKSTAWLDISTQYSIELAPCNKMKNIYGHVSNITQEILDQMGTQDSYENYSTGGDTYERMSYKTKIFVNAGQKIGELADSPEAAGIDFGTIDLRQKFELINPSRFQTGYVNEVSLVKYSTPEIKNLLYDYIQYNNATVPLRTSLPLEGVICYDVPGTTQGLWFFPGEPSTPEDPHLALIRHTYVGEKYVFSVGTSIPDLPYGSYEFFKETTGTYNRGFDDITDNQIYSFGEFTGYAHDPIAPGVVIIMQLVDLNTLKIEKKTDADGPPWSFSGNAVIFER